MRNGLKPEGALSSLGCPRIHAVVIPPLGRLEELLVNSDGAAERHARRQCFAGFGGKQYLAPHQRSPRAAPLIEGARQ